MEYEPNVPARNARPGARRLPRPMLTKPKPGPTGRTKRIGPAPMAELRSRLPNAWKPESVAGAMPDE